MPSWWAIVNLIFLGVGVPFIIGWVVWISRVKGQQLPTHRIANVERLARQAAISHIDADETVRMQLADKDLISLGIEYHVYASDEARLHALHTAFFDLKDG
jgi:hypothetical protein